MYGGLSFSLMFLGGVEVYIFLGVGGGEGWDEDRGRTLGMGGE